MITLLSMDAVTMKWLTVFLAWNPPPKKTVLWLRTNIWVFCEEAFVHNANSVALTKTVSALRLCKKERRNCKLRIAGLYAYQF